MLCFNMASYLTYTNKDQGNMLKSVKNTLFLLNFGRHFCRRNTSEYLRVSDNLARNRSRILSGNQNRTGQDILLKPELYYSRLRRGYNYASTSVQRAFVGHSTVKGHWGHSDVTSRSHADLLVYFGDNATAHAQVCYEMVANMIWLQFDCATTIGRHSFIGADTVLKLGHKLRRVPPPPPPNLRCAPNSGGTAGAYHSGNRHGENNTSLKNKALLTWRQSHSQPRRSGGASSSGRWAWGWVRTNVSPSIGRHSLRLRPK